MNIFNIFGIYKAESSLPYGMSSDQYDVLLSHFKAMWPHQDDLKHESNNARDALSDFTRKVGPWYARGLYGRVHQIPYDHLDVTNMPDQWYFYSAPNEWHSGKEFNEGVPGEIHPKVPWMEGSHSRGHGVGKSDNHVYGSAREFESYPRNYDSSSKYNPAPSLSDQSDDSRTELPFRSLSDVVRNLMELKAHHEHGPDPINWPDKVLQNHVPNRTPDEVKGVADTTALPPPDNFDTNWWDSQMDKMLRKAFGIYKANEEFDPAQGKLGGRYYSDLSPEEQEKFFDFHHRDPRGYVHIMRRHDPLKLRDLEPGDDRYTPLMQNLNRRMQAHGAKTGEFTTQQEFMNLPEDRIEELHYNAFLDMGMNPDTHELKEFGFPPLYSERQEPPSFDPEAWDSQMNKMLWKAFGIHKASDEELARLFHDSAKDHRDEMVEAFHQYTGEAQASHRYETNPREVHQRRKEIGESMGRRHQRLAEVQKYLEDRGINITDEAKESLGTANTLLRDLTQSPAQSPDWSFDPKFDSSAEGGQTFSSSPNKATRTPDQVWNVDKMLWKAFGIRKDSPVKTLEDYGTESDHGIFVPQCDESFCYDNTFNTLMQNRGIGKEDKSNLNPTIVHGAFPNGNHAWLEYDHPEHGKLVHDPTAGFAGSPKDMYEDPMKDSEHFKGRTGIHNGELIDSAHPLMEQPYLKPEARYSFDEYREMLTKHKHYGPYHDKAKERNDRHYRGTPHDHTDPNS